MAMTILTVEIQGAQLWDLMDPKTYRSSLGALVTMTAPVSRTDALKAYPIVQLAGIRTLLKTLVIPIGRW